MLELDIQCENIKRIEFSKYGVSELLVEEEKCLLSPLSLVQITLKDWTENWILSFSKFFEVGVTDVKYICMSKETKSVGGVKHSVLSKFFFPLKYGGMGQLVFVKFIDLEGKQCLATDNGIMNDVKFTCCEQLHSGVRHNDNCPHIGKPSIVCYRVREHY